jgi:hypothetical protein
MGQSTRELSDRAQELSMKLGKAIDTRGQNNQQLTALVEQLEAAVQAQASDSSPPAPAPAAPPPVASSRPAAQQYEPMNGLGDDEIGGPPDELKVPVPMRYALNVAPGRSIVGAQGHLDEGAEITLKDVRGDQASLDRLVREGYVVPRVL